MWHVHIVHVKLSTQKVKVKSWNLFKCVRTCRLHKSAVIFDHKFYRDLQYLLKKIRSRFLSIYLYTQTFTNHYKT